MIATLFVAALAALTPLGDGGAVNEYRAILPRTVGLYVGSQVSVLGVKVGEITGLNPQGTAVEVSFELDRGVRIPAEARAVVVAPTLVSDRRLELTPSYDSGPALPPGHEIPLERTAVPVEIDQVLAGVQELSTALGPRGANRDGALNELLQAGSRTLEGNGDRLNAAREFAAAHRLHVVLKGHRTIIAGPENRAFINLTGNAGMATGGTGDVLTGMIAAWFAQLLDPEAACQIAVYLHGLAGDHAAADEGEVSLMATDLVSNISDAIVELTTQKKTRQRES